AEDGEDGTDRLFPLLVVQRHDACAAPAELARAEALRVALVAHAGAERIGKLRGEIVGLAGVDARAEHDEGCAHGSLSVSVEPRQLADAAQELRGIHCYSP